MLGRDKQKNDQPTSPRRTIILVAVVIALFIGGFMFGTLLARVFSPASDEGVNVPDEIALTATALIIGATGTADAGGDLMATATALMAGLPADAGATLTAIGDPAMADVMATATALVNEATAQAATPAPGS
jgi:hypothetical protein